MKLPESFKPKENLDDKTEEMLTGKKLYEDLFTQFKNYLEKRAEGFNVMFYISDRFKESRYPHVKEIIQEAADKLHISNCEVHDFYQKVGSKDLDALFFRPVLDEQLIHIIYTSDAATEKLTADDRQRAVLFSIAFITTV